MNMACGSVPKLSDVKISPLLIQRVRITPIGIERPG
jgi:hypothetical protein